MAAFSLHKIFKGFTLLRAPFSIALLDPAPDVPLVPNFLGFFPSCDCTTSDPDYPYL